MVRRSVPSFVRTRRSIAAEVRRKKSRLQSRSTAKDASVSISRAALCRCPLHAEAVDRAEAVGGVRTRPRKLLALVSRRRRRIPSSSEGGESMRLVASRAVGVQS
eukprot:6172644-Pleurochrysis_carterae.AAC.1